MIGPVEELLLIRRMLHSKMGTLTLEEDVARLPDNSILRGGWFCVPHREGRLRLIHDRRPANAVEVTLPWATLPHGTDFCKLVVGPSESIRGSGDDLSNLFSQW